MTISKNDKFVEFKDVDDGTHIEPLLTIILSHEPNAIDMNDHFHINGYMVKPNEYLLLKDYIMNNKF